MIDRIARFRELAPAAVRRLSHEELYYLVVAVAHRLDSEERPAAQLAHGLAATLLPAARSEHLAALAAR